MFGILRRPLGEFARQARSRGVSSQVARLLEPVAAELCPQEPTRILESRELLERAAIQAVAGKGGDLELSFGVVDSLAATVEILGLARSSDVPDPFRRVWVTHETGMRRPGVVLACADGEVAVLAPAKRGRVPEAGSILKLSYRGFASTVEYDLRLEDPVRRPGGLILNLVRVDGQGAIGRAHRRYPVYFLGHLRLVQSESEGAAAHVESSPCEVLDISDSGLRVECAATYASGDVVWIEVRLPDGVGEAFAASTVVRWCRPVKEPRVSYGLLFTKLSQASEERLKRYLEQLESA